MHIEHPATADGCGWRSLPQYEAVTGQEHYRFAEFEPHQSPLSRFHCAVTVERDGCQRVRGERVEVDLGTMLQARATVQQSCLHIDGRHRAKRMLLDQGLAARHLRNLDAGQVESYTATGICMLFRAAMDLHPSHPRDAAAGFERKRLPCLQRP